MEIVVGVLTCFQGFISPAQKLQRKKILDHYQKEVKQAYGDS